jgi:hypothetical protein
MMIEALNLEGFQGAESRIRCFAHIFNLSVKVWCSYTPTLSWFSQGTKAILSQFSKKLEDDEIRAALAPMSRKKCPGAQHQQSATTSNLTRVPARQTHPPASDNNNNSNANMPHQDEDVIFVAEAAQQADLIDAEQLAELELTVTDSEQKIALMALVKVSSAIVVCRCKCLLIVPNSSLSLPTGSATCRALLRRWKHSAKLPSSSPCT